MLQRTEPIETSPTEASAIAPIASQAIRTEEEILAQNLDTEFEELAAYTTAGVAKGTRRTRTFLKLDIAVTIASMSIIPAWMFAMKHGAMAPDTLPKVILLSLAALCNPAILIGGLMWLRRDHTTKQERKSAQWIVEADDVRAVGPLIDLLTMTWTHKSELRPALWQALGRRLPRMTADEAQALGQERHYILASWIVSWDVPLNRRAFADAGEPLLLDLLHVFALIGESSFRTRKSPIPVPMHLLPTLKKWADGKGAGQNPAVRQAAAACREALKQKTIWARPGEQLLRASAPTPAGSDTLLRPTQGAQQTEPTELLRPSDPE